MRKIPHLPLQGESQEQRGASHAQRHRKKADADDDEDQAKRDRAEQGAAASFVFARLRAGERAAGFRPVRECPVPQPVNKGDRVGYGDRRCDVLHPSIGECPRPPVEDSIAQRRELTKRAARN